MRAYVSVVFMDVIILRFTERTIQRMFHDKFIPDHTPVDRTAIAPE